VFCRAQNRHVRAPLRGAITALTEREQRLLGGRFGLLRAAALRGGIPLNPRTTMTLGALSVLSLQLTACEMVKGIFKAGMWVGVLGVLAVLVLGALAFSRLRH